MPLTARRAALILAVAVLVGCQARAPAGAPARPSDPPAESPPAANPPAATHPAPPPAPPAAGGGEEVPLGDAVRLATPQPYDEVSGDTIHLAGAARTFEGTVLVTVEDGHRLLAEEVITAGAGAPEWGSFAAEVRLKELPTNRTLTLTLYTISAKDGSWQEQAVVPLRYTGPCAANRC